MKLILDPVSCKPIFVSLNPPLATHPFTATARPPPPGTLYHPLGQERTSDLSIAAARSFLLSAAIGLNLSRSCLSPHITQPCVCFAEISRVSLSFVITSGMMISCDYFFRRQRTSFIRRQPALWHGRLPLGTAERRRGAAHLKIYVAAVLQRISGVAPPRQRTNAGCPLFLGHARKLIYAEGAYLCIFESSYLN